MKLILTLALVSTLVSCTGIENPERPTAELTHQVAPLSNQVLDAHSRNVGRAVRMGMDVPDDTSALVGRVAVRQATNHTNIGFGALRRADDLVLRETSRYTDYGLDTLDKAANLEARSITHWSRFGSTSAKRVFGSTRTAYQASVAAYGDAVDRSYFSFWDIFVPPETKPWMVGSKNDCLKCCGPFEKVPGGMWTKNFAPNVLVMDPPVTDGKFYAGRVTK